jgi:hypothetical protein
MPLNYNNIRLSFGKEKVSFEFILRPQTILKPPHPGFPPSRWKGTVFIILHDSPLLIHQVKIRAGSFCSFFQNLIPAFAGMTKELKDPRGKFSGGVKRLKHAITLGYRLADIKFTLGI